MHEVMTPEDFDPGMVRPEDFVVEGEDPTKKRRMLKYADRAGKSQLGQPMPDRNKARPLKSRHSMAYSAYSRRDCSPCLKRTSAKDGINNWQVNWSEAEKFAPWSLRIAVAPNSRSKCVSTWKQARQFPPMNCHRIGSEC
jgi:hypothetical protein